MEFAEAQSFLETYHRGVVTTFRRSGAAQMSILACGPYMGAMTFVVRGNTAKLANLRKAPRCTVLTVSPDWRGYVVVEGTSTIHGWDNTDAAPLQLMLREAYTACGGGEHPDWEEYDRVMKEERRAVVMVQPQHVYGRL